MRTIKFKAKAIKDGSWTFGDLFHALNDICINPEHGFKRQQRYLTVVAPTPSASSLAFKIWQVMIFTRVIYWYHTLSHSISTVTQMINLIQIMSE